MGLCGKNINGFHGRISGNTDIIIADVIIFIALCISTGLLFFVVNILDIPSSISISITVGYSIVGSVVVMVAPNPSDLRFDLATGLSSIPYHAMVISR
jgi:hypothetical protein